MQLDLATIAVLGAVQMPAIAALVWMRAPADRLLSSSAPRAWAVALLFSACGLALLALQKTCPSAPLLGAALSLLLTTWATFATIIRALVGAPRRRRVSFTIALAGSAIAFAADIGPGSHHACVRAFAITLLTLGLMQAWPLRHALKGEEYRAQRLLLLISAMTAVASVWLLLRPEAMDPPRTGTMTLPDGVALALTVMAPTLLSLGFVPLYADRDMRRRQPLAHIDPVTGALNRRAIVQRSRQLFATSMRHGRGLTLLMLQIDHFERLQTLLGRAAETHILPPVCDCLHDVLRAEDVIGRSDRDTFVLLLPDSDPNGAAEAAERLRETIRRRPIFTSRRKQRITVSIGIASMLPGDSDLQPMLRRAARALAAARRAGCNRISSHAPLFREMEDNTPPSSPRDRPQR